jgi:hypothetical protein
VYGDVESGHALLGVEKPGSKLYIPSPLFAIILFEEKHVLTESAAYRGRQQDRHAQPTLVHRALEMV